MRAEEWNSASRCQNYYFRPNKEIRGNMSEKPSARDTRPKARIFAVEDHAISQHGLIRLIIQQADMVVRGEADNVRAALAGITQTKPDLVTVDATDWMRRNEGSWSGKPPVPGGDAG